jgi:hypothetical protein
MRKLLCAFFAVGLISATACGGSKKTAATPDKAMNNAGGSDTMGSGSGSGSGSGMGSGSAMNPCNGGGTKSPAPDPCSGAE